MSTIAVTAGAAAVQAGSKLGNSMLGKLANAVRAGSSISSLTDIGKSARVEPLVLVDKSLGDQPYMTDIMKMSMSIFTGYYMQAVSMIIPVGRINTVRVLDALNPDRGRPGVNVKNVVDAVWSKEAYAQGLPSMEAFNQPMEPKLVVSFEAREFDDIDDARLRKAMDDAERARLEVERTRIMLEKAKDDSAQRRKQEADLKRAEADAERAEIMLEKAKDDQLQKAKAEADATRAKADAERAQLTLDKLKAELEESKSTKSNMSASVDSDSVKKLYEIESLAVGKMISVELKDGDQSAKIPVMIRMIPTSVPPAVLTHIFTATAKNSSWKERYHLWRAGQISFVRDLMFSVDLIDEHRRALINDTTNVYMTISDRKRNNALKAGATKNASMADASNIAIISKSTAKDIGRAMYGKLESQAVRKRVFDATMLMLLVVVDEQWERVTIYHRGIDLPTELSFREIKAAEKGKGPDITEILKAYQLGSTPSI